jgi:hypothetical protein
MKTTLSHLSLKTHARKRKIYTTGERCKQFITPFFIYYSISTTMKKYLSLAKVLRDIRDSPISDLFSLGRAPVLLSFPLKRPVSCFAHSLTRVQMRLKRSRIRFNDLREFFRTRHCEDAA